MIFLLLLIMQFSVYTMVEGKDIDDPLLKLALMVSSANQNVSESINLFTDDKSVYYENYKSELFERGIESAHQITPEIALIDSLSREGLLVYADVSQEPDDVLEQLATLSNKKIKQCEGYKPLLEYYKNTEYGIGEFFDEKGEWPSIFNCVRDAGLRLLAIDEDSDAYALLIVENGSAQETLEAFKQANVRLYYFRGE